LLGLDLPSTLLALADDVIEQMRKSLHCSECLLLARLHRHDWPGITAAFGGEPDDRQRALVPRSSHVRTPAKLPTVGLLHLQVSGTNERVLAAFHKGLEGTGFVEGQNLAIEYRWTQQADQVLDLATDLVRSRVKVVVTAGGSLPALAAKTARSSLPIVFMDVPDPIKVGLVTSLTRPGGNATGIIHIEQRYKQFELLNELVPQATVIGYLFDSRIPGANDAVQELLLTAFSFGQQVVLVEVPRSSVLVGAFARLVEQRADVLMVALGPLPADDAKTLIAFATHHTIPTSYQFPDVVYHGGIMRYGADSAEHWRLAGIYAGRILQGAKPAGLPIVQATKCELVINLRAARVIGFDIPRSLTLIANEVFE
jgi:putative ABC transport system substrate-binding protein